MKESLDQNWNSIERSRRKICLANLEADVAYFQARLEILGRPQTTNQIAQRKVFKLLHESLGDMILKTKRRMIEEKAR